MKDAFILIARGFLIMLGITAAFMAIMTVFVMLSIVTGFVGW